jgi:hypothetical protein
MRVFHVVYYESSVWYFTSITIFTTPHQLGKKEKLSVFLSRQFSASLTYGVLRG